MLSADSKFTKIGYSTDPVKRLKGLQTACPFKLKIRSFFVGNQSDEKSVHDKFSKFRTSANNEFFYFDESIVAFFDEKCPVEQFGSSLSIQ